MTGYRPIKAECVECGDEFYILPGEQRFMDSRGLALPKRCRPCREILRKEKAQRDKVSHDDK